MRLDRINILAFYITVYRQAAIFAESSRRFLATDQVTLDFVFLVHMVPPAWWAASSWCCDPISYAVMRVYVQETRATSSGAWDQ
jgi:hypothetical protein